jgi:hypothetical protein
MADLATSTDGSAANMTGPALAIRVIFGPLLGFAAIRGAQWTPHIRNGGQESVVADRSGGVSLCRVRL